MVGNFRISLVDREGARQQEALDFQSSLPSHSLIRCLIAPNCKLPAAPVEAAALRLAIAAWYHVITSYGAAVQLPAGRARHRESDDHLNKILVFKKYLL